MSKTKWIIFCVLTIGVFGFLIIYSQNTKIDTKTIDSNTIQVASNQNGNIAEHVYGNTKSKVILINYGDYQCSACGVAHPQIKSIVEEYKDKIQFVFRNYPITSLHPNAKAAAGAAEAAGMQGKYWQMHDKLYEDQSGWDSLSGTERSSKFESYAKELGLDVNKFNNDIASSAVTQKINYDVAIGTKINITGTPTFYLNGKMLDSALWSDEAKLKAELDSVISKNQ